MERVEVVIAGRDYTLACSPAEKDALLEAVRYVDQTMTGIQGSGRVSSNEHVAVMAALKIATQLLSMKAPDGKMGGLAVGEFKRKIDDINALLDTALSQQVRLL